MSNLVKVRDDNTWIEFEKNTNTDQNNEFKLLAGSKPSWCEGDTFSVSELRNRVEPWLTSLFQSEHLSLLVGSGLSTAVQYIASKGADNGMEAFIPKSKFANQIVDAAKKSSLKAGRGENPNFEDYVRIMTELLRGLEIQGDEEDAKELKAELNQAIEDFTDNISNIENSIATANERERARAFNYLVMFLLSFASRTGTRDRLNVFTTNYDRIIEAGADIAGVRMLDRFVGSMTPIFRSSRLNIDMHYNPPGMRGEPRYLEGVVHYTKLHGSIDWVSSYDDIKRIALPFGAPKIEPYLHAPGLSGQAMQIMIYPNSTKDRETSEYPYVDLFRDFAAALCRPNNTLITYGYSFGDEHINRIIKDMLTIPSTHLVMISYDDRLGRIKNIYDGWGRSNQISILVGSEVADLEKLVKYYLPKPAIDYASDRLEEILNKRYTQTASGNDHQGDKYL